MKNRFLRAEKKREEEERGRGTPYLLLDLSDYRDNDTTLCRKISSHSQSWKGFSFFLEIPQTCPPAPSASLSSGYELNPDPKWQTALLHLFYSSKEKQLSLSNATGKERRGCTCSLCSFTLLERSEVGSIMQQLLTGGMTHSQTLLGILVDLKDDLCHRLRCITSYFAVSQFSLSSSE